MGNCARLFIRTGQVATNGIAFSRNHFPKPAGLQLTINRLKLFNRIVADIKPYVVGGDLLVKILHDLDVSDKHWLLTPLLSVAEVRDIVMENEEGSIVTWNSYPLASNGPYHVPIPFECTIKNKGKLAVNVVFDENYITALQGISVMSDLNDFSETAVDVVQLLENPFLD
jgi:hypothetical protein